MGHPFPYVGSGVAEARRAMECWLCFRDEVPPGARKQVERGIPGPLTGYLRWFERVLVFGNDDDSLQEAVRATYDGLAGGIRKVKPGVPSRKMWRAFNADLDGWLLGVHARHPIALFVKPIEPDATSADAWHDWSCEHIPDLALPTIAELGEPHADVGDYLAQVWRAWAEGRPFEHQRALMAALNDTARTELAKRKALFTPMQAPPAPSAPSLEQSETLWRRCADALEPMPRGPRLEDAFTTALIEHGLDPAHSLTCHLDALRDAERHAEAVALARAALDSGVEEPTHWYSARIDSLIALGRTDEAAEEMPNLVGTLESYSPGTLVAAMTYHRATNETATVSMLYHAGKQWFTSFASYFGRADAAGFGAKPPDLSRQFAAWLTGWCAGEYFDLATQPRLGHFLAWFEKIGASAFGPWVARFEAERERRVALHQALETAASETAAQALVDQLLPSAETEDAARAFHPLRERAPLAAYRYLVGAIRNERRCFYRYPRGGRVDAVVSAMYLALNVPELAERLEETYGIARGYLQVANAALHFNLACCACRLGRRADALGHIARALALDWPDPRRMHDDGDLAPLRGDAAFEQIFFADATRRADIQTRIGDAPERATKAFSPKRPAKARGTSARPRREPSRKGAAKPASKAVSKRSAAGTPKRRAKRARGRVAKKPGK
jgi:hypothetical protein